MYRIERNNTDVKKLWYLAYNGVIDRRTVSRIFERSEDGYIVFNSKMIYDRFKTFEYSTLAMYKN